MLKKRGRRVPLGLLGILLWIAGGCQEPTEIVPAGLPGTPSARVPPPGEKEPEALGEAAVRTPVDATKKQPVAGTISPPTEIGETRTTPSGVTYETLKAGAGVEARPGQSVVVNYKGTLTDGTVFDTSHKPEGDKPATLELSAGAVIGGWVEGVPGMKVGEVRKLTVPPGLAYGAQGQPPTIPADATLVFEVELVEIK